MKSRALPAQLPASYVVSGRYLLGTAVHVDVWGQTFRAQDLNQGTDVCVREYLVPPLRRGLEERLAAFRAAAGSLCDRVLPGVSRLLGVVEEEGRIFVISEWVDGVSLQSWADAPRSRPALDPLRLGMGAAVGLRALLQAGAIQAVLHLEPRHVIVDSRGRATISNHGLGHFFRPMPAVPLTPHEAERIAIGRVGETMYLAFASVPWTADSVLAESELTEPLRDILPRCLGGDTTEDYDSLDALVADLSLAGEAETEVGQPASPLPDTPGVQPGPARLLLALPRILASVLWHGLRRQPSWRQAVLGVLVLMLAAVAGRSALRVKGAQPPLAMSEVVVYGLTVDGQVIVFDAARRTQSGTLLKDVTAVAVSDATAMLFAAHAPSGTVRAGSMLEPAPFRSLAVRGGVERLVLTDDGAWLFCIGAGGMVTQVNSHRFASVRVLPLGRRVTHGAWLAARQSLLLATEAPARLLLLDPERSTRPRIEAALTAPARTLQVHPDGREIWIVVKGSRRVLVLDVETLELEREVTLPEEVLDLDFSSDGLEAYVLQPGGLLAFVRVADFQIVSTVDCGVGAVVLELATPDALWVAAGERVVVVDPLLRSVTARLQVASPLRDLLAQRRLQAR